MNFGELLLIAAGLSMDAFAVSVCKGLSMKHADYRKGAVIALFFGIFQAGMPLAGWLLGRQFAAYITGIEHWISFLLLFLVGVNMIVDARQPGTCEEKTETGGLYDLIILSIATSIDALAVGITFAFLPDKTAILPSVSVIGLVTFLFCFFGVMIGSRLGDRYQTRAQIAGGGVLICIGIKLLLEHIGLFPI